MPKGCHPGIFFAKIPWISSHSLFLCQSPCFLDSMSLAFLVYSIILAAQILQYLPKSQCIGGKFLRFQVSGNGSNLCSYLIIRHGEFEVQNHFPPKLEDTVPFSSSSHYCKWECLMPFQFLNLSRGHIVSLWKFLRLSS